MDKINLSASMMVYREPEDAKTILSTSVMYAISDSGVNQPADGWSPSVLATTPSQPWLWTRTTITYSEGEPSVSYSVSRQGTDGTNGTSFTPKGMAFGHFSKASTMEGYSLYLPYLLDQDDVSEPNILSPCVGIYGRVSGVAKLSTSKSSVGDAYRIDSNLWVNNGTEWVDFGDIQGPAGEAGEDALIAEVNPNPTVFQTNDKGAIVNLFGTAAIKVYLGSANVTKRCNFELVTDKNTFSNFTVGESSVDIKSTDVTDAGKGLFFFCNAITTDPVSVENNGNTETYNVARTAGYFTIKCIYGERVCYAKVQFSVSVSAFFLSYIRNDYEMKSQYQKLENKQGELVKTTSTLEQTAETLGGKIEVIAGDYVKNADISMFVSHDENGVIDTNITMNADNININGNHRLDIVSDGCMTISTSNFKLDKQGNVTCTNGNFSGTVNAMAGTIGGFKINDSSIGSADRDGSIKGMHLSNEQIIFNTNYGQGIFGAYFLSGGYCYGSRVELNGGQNNIGLYINAKSSGIYNNFAIYAENGNAVVKGMNAGIKFSKATLNANTWNPYAINLQVNNVWHIECNGDNSILVLPTLNSVENALGNSGTYEPFSIRITIIGYRSSTKAFTLAGRSTNTNLGYSTQEYPWLYNYDAENTSFAMSRGDVCELQLTYDGSVYYAQVLSLNR